MIKVFVLEYIDLHDAYFTLVIDKIDNSNNYR